MRIGRPRPHRRVQRRYEQHFTISFQLDARSSSAKSLRQRAQGRPANRANAQRSTGPRTPQGKQRSSLNALRHGILAKSAFNDEIDGEEKRAEFDGLVAGLAQEYQPQTMTETMTVQQLAGCYWKLAKVWRYEQERSWAEWNCFDGNTEQANITEKNVFEKMDDAERAIEDGKFLRAAGLVEPTIPGASVNTILRYQGAIQTMITRCIALLERRRKERIKSGAPFKEVDYINEATGAKKVAENKAPASRKMPPRTNEPKKNATSMALAGAATAVSIAKLAAKKAAAAAPPQSPPPSA